MFKGISSLISLAAATLHVHTCSVALSHYTLTPSTDKRHNEQVIDMQGYDIRTFQCTIETADELRLIRFAQRTSGTI